MAFSGETYTRMRANLRKDLLGMDPGGGGGLCGWYVCLSGYKCLGDGNKRCGICCGREAQGWRCGEAGGEEKAKQGGKGIRLSHGWIVAEMRNLIFANTGSSRPLFEPFLDFRQPRTQ